MDQFLAQTSTFFQGLPQQLSLDLVFRVVIIYCFVIWGALVVWIIKDITNRTTNLFLQVLSILIILLLTPIFGLPIYLLIRPRATIFEKFYENAELDMIESEERNHVCFSCNAPIEKEFHFCPYCRIELKNPCIGCQELIQKNWQLCPFCGIEQTKNTETKPKKMTKKKVIDLTIEAQTEVEKEVSKEMEV